MNYTLIEEARKKYPIGTKIRAINSNYRGDFDYEIKFTKYEYFNSQNQLYINRNLLIYHNKIWTEIISLPDITCSFSNEDYTYLIKLFKQLEIK